MNVSSFFIVNNTLIPIITHLSMALISSILDIVNVLVLHLVSPEMALYTKPMFVKDLSILFFRIILLAQAVTRHPSMLF